MCLPNQSPTISDHSVIKFRYSEEAMKKSANFIWRYFYVRKGWDFFSNCGDLLRIIELYSLHGPNSYLNKRNLQYKRTIFKFSLFDQDVK